VPDIRPLSEQLKRSAGRKAHFALVVDEYGEVMGLVRSRTFWRKSSATFPTSTTSW
jgi:Mg2+/Co2+ transporter CorC